MPISKIPELTTISVLQSLPTLSWMAFLQLAPLALHLNNADIRSYYIGREMSTAWMTPGGRVRTTPLTGQSIPVLLSAGSLPFTPGRKPGSSTVEVRNGTANPAWERAGQPNGSTMPVITPILLTAER